MADDKKTEKGSGEGREAKESVELTAKGKGKGVAGLMMPLVILSMLIGLAGLGMAGYFLFTQKQSAEATTEEGGEEATAEITETNIYFEGFEEEPDVVNLAVTEDAVFTYLKYSFAVEVDSETVVEELGTKLPRIRAQVSAVMSNRVWAEISTASGRESLAREVLAAINGQLSEGQCIGIYFTTFVAQ